MATAGGTPPVGNSPKPKREFTPDQKRMFAGLGVAGVLLLIVGVMYVPPMLSGGGSNVPIAPPTSPSSGSGATNGAADAVSQTPTTAPGAGLPGSGAGSGAGGAAVGAALPGTASAEPVVFVSRSRVDPFQPVYIIPPPAPTPTPLPPPDPEIPISAPSGFENGITLAAIKDPALRARAAAPLNIGVPVIPRLDTITVPRDPFPVSRGGDNNGGGGGPQQSYDKRLAGIIIGDGVRALLELPSGEQRVVQPGDEIEGVRVLSIERFRQGDRTVTRMLVRDTDGSQKYVELKPSSQPQQAAGGEGGLGGPTGVFGGPR